jgi:acetyl-CoA synthetase
MPNDMTAPSAEFAANAHIDAAKYKEMYAASIADPEAFWGEHGKRIDWIKPYTKVKDVSFAPGNISIKWFEDGTLNVCANCVDRHVATRGDQTAIIWEPTTRTTRPSTSPTASCTAKSARWPISSRTWACGKATAWSSTCR